MKTDVIIRIIGTIICAIVAMICLLAGNLPATIGFLLASALWLSKIEIEL